MSGSSEHIEFADVEATAVGTAPVPTPKDDHPGRIGPWPLTRNGSCSLAAVESEEPPKSEFTVTMENVDRQYTVIQQMLDTEEIALRNDGAELRRYIQEREHRQEAERRRERDVQTHANLLARIERLRREPCQWCTQYARAASVGKYILALSVLIIAACPVLFLKIFFEDKTKMAAEFLGREGVRWEFLGALAMPVYGVTVAVSIAWTSLVALGGMKTPPRPRTKGDVVVLVANCVGFGLFFYAWCCAMMYPLLFG